MQQAAECGLLRRSATARIRRYSVPGTLAHDLKAEPESVALPDGRKIACRASTKVISFSAHSDYPETAKFIDELAVKNVVLVHGEEHGAVRMKLCFSKVLF